MISSAEEFYRLRNSSDLSEQKLATTESADLDIWLDVITNYPELKEWVAHNKTIQMEILEFLSKDSDVNVRCAVARKRKISAQIFNTLKSDSHEEVRYALMCNTKLALEKKRQIVTDDSDWLHQKFIELIENSG